MGDVVFQQIKVFELSLGASKSQNEVGREFSGRGAQMESSQRMDDESSLGKCSLGIKNV
jgi:hypothetical protein